jgi:hypothetical protein
MTAALFHSPVYFRGKLRDSVTLPLLTAGSVSAVSTVWKLILSVMCNAFIILYNFNALNFVHS